MSSRGIGEDERQPVMARLAARWRRSNLVRLVALRKGNHHPGEALVRRGRRKYLYRTERDSLEEAPRGSRDIAYGLETWEKLPAFSEDTCLEKPSAKIHV